MSEKIIVLVTDKGDSKHGEISVLDDAAKAERLVETLLEAGFEQERIKVFAGRSSEFQISHRPVVSLAGDGDEPRDASSEVYQPKRLQPAAEEPAAAQEEAVASAETQDTASAEGEAEEVSAEGEAAEPVRFSSLFRSA